MKCPECGADMILRETKKFTTKDGKAKKFYGCERWPACKGTHGAHPDGKPLGIPGNAETKIWRHKAHTAFDEAFKDIKRRHRYKELQRLMGLNEADAHIGRFDIEQCKRLIALLEESHGKVNVT